MRNDFYQTGGTRSITNYGIGQAAWDTLISPAFWDSTAFQAGGFAGATAVNNNDGTATFTVTNVVGVRSFFYLEMWSEASPRPCFHSP